MRHLATDDDREVVSAVPGRALVALSHSPEDSQGIRRIGRRPEAGFLAQLLVSSEPALRTSRLDRTRSAAAHYAQAAKRYA